MSDERAETGRGPSGPRRPQRAIGALLVPLILAACGAPPRPSPPVPGPTEIADRPAHAPRPAHTRDPRLTGSVAKPTPTDDDERSAIRALLPAGAVVGSDRERAAWVPRRPDGSVLSVYSVPYRLDGQASVAAVLRKPWRLLWDLREHPELTDGLEAAWPMEMFRGAGLIVVRNGAAYALILDLLADPAVVVHELSLPADLKLKRGSSDLTRATFLTRDLTGDGRSDPVLEVDGRLLLYEARPQLGPRLIASAGPTDLLLDQDRDGLPELVAAAGPGAWTRRGWKDGAFRDLGSLRVPDLPTPEAISVESLPELPGALTYAHANGRTVMRWPRQGGPEQMLWRSDTDDTVVGRLQVTDDGRNVGFTVGPDMKGGRPQLMLLTMGDEPRELPTHGELRAFEISADGHDVVYIGLDVGLDGHPLAPDDASGDRRRGTVFVVTTDAPHLVRGIASCEAVVVPGPENLGAGCMGAMALSATSRRIAFADGRGVWDASLDGDEPRRLVEQRYVPPFGVESRVYWPVRWSPGDRHLLAEVGGYEGSQPAIIDLDGGTPSTIPDAFSHGSMTEQVWSPDGGILLLTRWEAYDEPRAEVRLVDAADPASQTAVIDLVPISEHRRLRAYGPAVAADGSVRFGLRERDDRWLANGVYRAERDGSSLRRLAALPPMKHDSDMHRQLLVWSPDGDAFVVRFADGVDEGMGLRTVVGLADGSALWDASAVLNDADWITWSR